MPSEIKTKVDFFLNGGDSIHAADYDNIKREQVIEQWAVWDKCISQISDYELQLYWKSRYLVAAPSKEDEMYGKDYVVKD
ncbi:hypothetical protein CS542_02395 [Pedobacter sp. IW39]|nr:hypothetical protein CS542_02395 [Pedobacter sp. IW39]